MVLCQLEIKQILVKDFYGDTNNVSVKDYFNYKSDDSITMSLEQLQPDQDQTLHETFPFPTNHAKVARDLVHAASKFATAICCKIYELKSNIVSLPRLDVYGNYFHY